MSAALPPDIARTDRHAVSPVKVRECTFRHVAPRKRTIAHLQELSGPLHNIAVESQDGKKDETPTARRPTRCNFNPVRSGTPE